MLKLKRKGDIEWLRVTTLLEERLAKEEPPADEEQAKARAEAQAKTLEGLAGLEVGLEHVGPSLAKEWIRKGEAVTLANLRELRDLRREFTREEAPQFYEADAAPGAVERLADYAREVLLSCVVGLRGVEGLATERAKDVGERESIVDALMGLGLGLVLAEEAARVQRLRPDHAFS